MADRIERYLGRLEAELEGRVDGARLTEILDEVEGHLRESEEGWRELGEPDALANRLAVEGFGGIASISNGIATHSISVDENGWRGGLFSASFALVWGFAVWAVWNHGNIVTWVMPAFWVSHVVLGFLLVRRWRTVLRGAATAGIGVFVIGMSFFGGVWENSTGTAWIQGLVKSEQDMRAGGVPLATARIYLARAKEKQAQLDKMGSWWKAIGEGKQSPMPIGTNEQYLVLRDGKFSWGAKPDIETYGVFVNDRDDSLAKLKAEINGWETEIERTVAVQNSTLSKKLRPVFHVFVGVIYGYGLLCLLILGGVGAGLRLLFELALVGLKSKRKLVE